MTIFSNHKSSVIFRGGVSHCVMLYSDSIIFPQGYNFEAEANGHHFTVKVPVGGVEQGQKFSVPFPAGANGYSGAFESRLK